jgi:hypothetical protein
LTLSASVSPVLAQKSESPGAASETQVFPAEGISAPPYTPYEGAGVESSTVTFNGLWDGSCSAYGTDNYHASPTSYTAGTFRMTVDGMGNLTGYCIDVQHTVSAGQSWTANVYAARDADFCAINWILATYQRAVGSPADPYGLTETQRGAAIQAAIWHYAEGFEPEWDTGHWCAGAAGSGVFDWATDIIAAAQGQCIAMPASLDLTAFPTLLPLNQTSDLTATVLDQLAQPFQGQTVDFATTVGTLGAASAATDALGEADNTITHNAQDTAQVTASIAGTSATAAVDDVAGTKQRIIVVKNTDFGDDADTSVSWEPCLPTIEFEMDAASNTLATGQIIDDEWAAWGVHVTTQDPVLYPAMIFDSANPTGGDPDLGTPNVDFGGPGIGAGGGAGQPGANMVPLGKILIVSEDGDQTDPDDKGDGGTLIFTFDYATHVHEVYILDIDEGSAGVINAYSDVDGNNLITSAPMLDLGDNSFQIVTVNTDNVRRLEVVFPGSGGVPGIVFCDPNPTAVTLTSFTAKARQNAVVLKWETATEIDNLGFNVYRAESPDGPWSQLNGNLIPSLVPPGSPVGAQYTYRDRTARPGVKYFYRLESVDTSGNGVFHGPVDAQIKPRAPKGQ